MIWNDRSFVEDISIIDCGGYILAEYEPLDLHIEASDEKSARDELMYQIFASVLHLYEETIRGIYHTAPTVKNIMDDFLVDYYQTHERSPVIRDEKMGIVELEVDLPLMDLMMLEDINDSRGNKESYQQAIGQG